MPVWNGEKYLREAVESILLRQSFTDFEFIVVDDGSVDSTGEILENYRDPRMRVFPRPHGGLVEALNFGVAAARAPWIARQDADDVSLPDRLERLWAACKSKSHAIAFHSDVEAVMENGAQIRSPVLPQSRALLALKMCFQCPITHSTVMFQKAAFERAGGYLQQEYYAEDFGLWGRMLEIGSFISLNARLLRYRIHAASLSKVFSGAQLEITRATAVRHCQKFLGLNEAEAQRAFEILGQSPCEKKWQQWQWFLTRCIPRARWKSPEMFAWLASHTARVLFAR